MMARTLDTTQTTDDRLFAAFSAVHVTALQLGLETPLTDVQARMEAALTVAHQDAFNLIVACFVGQLSLIVALRDLTPSFVSWTDTAADEATFEQQLEDNPQLAI